MGEVPLYVRTECRKSPPRNVDLQDYLAYKKSLPPYDQHGALGIDLLCMYGPREVRLLVSEVPLYASDLTSCYLEPEIFASTYGVPRSK